MSINFSVPRGTADILPDTITLWENLETTARRILKSYGYREIRTPMYEETALFKRSLGQTSDIVNKQLLELATEKEEGYALRPEGTAAVVRSYIENSFDKKEPLSKLFYIGPMFRGERPQKGRLRQFHQIGVEAIGPNSASPYLDAEILALAMHLLTSLGVKDAKLKINSLGSSQDKEDMSLWLRRELGNHKNELCEECQSRYERNVFRVLDCKNESCKKVVARILCHPDPERSEGEGSKKDASPSAQHDGCLPLSKESLKYFQDVQNALTALGITYEVSPHLVRGLDYYTHTVFEITAEGGLGSQDAVGAGGRYSGLIQQLGGDAKTNFGAIGFALGMERILLAAEKTQAEPAGLDAFVIAMDEAYQPQAFLLVDSLRKEGISADMSYSGGSIKSQMNRANKLNARFALILGEQEIKDGTVAVKDMRLSQQEIVPQKTLLITLKEKL